MIRQRAQLARRLVRCALGTETFYRADLRCRHIMLGREGAEFAINPELLGPSSVIYSFGIGTDISFDLDCITECSVQVYAFDPTPRSLAWIATQQLPSGLHVFPYGIADFDGAIALYPPNDPSHVSYSQVDRGGEATKCPVYRLRSLMQMFGHSHVDVLKMDIEGGEYDVIADILKVQIPIRQLCVEFHHRWPEIGCARTECAIEALREAGYRIFHVSPSGQEFSFVHVTGR